MIAQAIPVTDSNRYAERESGFGHQSHSAQANTKPASNATKAGATIGMLA